MNSMVSFWRSGTDRRYFMVILLDSFFDKVPGNGMWQAVTDDFGNLVAVVVPA